MGVSVRIAAVAGALLYSAAVAREAQAQVQFQCQLYASERQRTECLRRQAAAAPGRDCLFFCPPPPPLQLQPAKSKKSRPR